MRAGFRTSKYSRTHFWLHRVLLASRTMVLWLCRNPSLHQEASPLHLASLQNPEQFGPPHTTHVLLSRVFAQALSPLFCVDRDIRGLNTTTGQIKGECFTDEEPGDTHKRKKSGHTRHKGRRRNDYYPIFLILQTFRQSCKTRLTLILTGSGRRRARPGAGYYPRLRLRRLR